MTVPVRQQALLVQAQENREGFQIGLSHGGGLTDQPLDGLFDGEGIPPFTHGDLGSRPLSFAFQSNTYLNPERQSGASWPEAGPTTRVVLKIGGHGVQVPVDDAGLLRPECNDACRPGSRKRSMRQDRGGSDCEPLCVALLHALFLLHEPSCVALFHGLFRLHLGGPALVMGSACQEALKCSFFSCESLL